MWSPEPMGNFSFRGRPSAPPLSRVEPRPFSFILPSAKIHFSVGFSFISSKHSFDGNPFLPFVGALRHFVPLFLANLLASSVRSPYAVGATLSSTLSSFARFFCAYFARRRGDPVWSPEPMGKFFFAAVHRFSFVPSKHSFDGNPLFPASLMHICSFSVLPSHFDPRSIYPLFLCVFRTP